MPEESKLSTISQIAQIVGLIPSFIGTWLLLFPPNQSAPSNTLGPGNQSMPRGLLIALIFAFTCFVIAGVAQLVLWFQRRKHPEAKEQPWKTKDHWRNLYEKEHEEKERLQLKLNVPAWSSYGSEEKMQEAVNEQNRLVTIGHTFDGMFSVRQIQLLNMIKEIKELRDEIGPEPKVPDAKNMTPQEVNKFNDNYSRPWRMKLSSIYERRFAHRVKDLMLRCEEDGIAANQLRHFTGGGIRSEEQIRQLLSRLARLVFDFGGIEIGGEL